MIRLRKFEQADGQQLIEWAISPDFLLQWAGPQFTYPLTDSQIQTYLRASEGQNPTRKIYTAYEDETQQTVGHIELNNIDHINHSATVCRVLVSKASRGQGIAGEMLSHLLKIGFNEIGLHRIDLFVFDTNHSAIRSYEKIGFVREGLLRDARCLAGQYYNLLQMSILRTEWDVSGTVTQ